MLKKLIAILKPETTEQELERAKKVKRGSFVTAKRDSEEPSLTKGKPYIVKSITWSFNPPEVLYGIIDDRTVRQNISYREFRY